MTVTSSALSKMNQMNRVSLAEAGSGADVHATGSAWLTIPPRGISTVNTRNSSACATTCSTPRTVSASSCSNFFLPLQMNVDAAVLDARRTRNPAELPRLSRTSVGLPNSPSLGMRPPMGSPGSSFAGSPRGVLKSGSVNSSSTSNSMMAHASSPLGALSLLAASTLGTASSPSITHMGGTSQLQPQQNISLLRPALSQNTPSAHCSAGPRSVSVFVNSADNSYNSPADSACSSPTRISGSSSARYSAGLAGSPFGSTQCSRRASVVSSYSTHPDGMFQAAMERRANVRGGLRLLSDDALALARNFNDPGTPVRRSVMSTGRTSSPAAPSRGGSRRASYFWQLHNQTASASSLVVPDIGIVAPQGGSPGRMSDCSERSPASCRALAEADAIAAARALVEELAADTK